MSLRIYWITMVMTLMVNSMVVAAEANKASTDRQAALQQQLKAREQAIHEVEQQLTQVPGQADVMALMQRMVKSLKGFVQADLPFHLDKRKARVDRLESMLEQKEISPTDQLRKILAVYKEELEYGRTIEAYDGELKEAGARKRLVTFIRYGRVALVYQTFDGKQTAVWNRVKRSWRPLSKPFPQEVRKGIKIALKRTPPDLIVLPVQLTEQKETQ